MNTRELARELHRHALAIREEYRARGEEPSTKEISTTLRERHPDLYEAWYSAWIWDIVNQVDREEIAAGRCRKLSGGRRIPAGRARLEHLVDMALCDQDEPEQG
jgi:hypothetical protein